MTGTLSRLPAIQAALDNLTARHRVPGASLAILDGDEHAQLVTGVTSRTTAVAVTPDTLFQIGSITKVYTTTMVMQLVDEGALALDHPVSTYLPQLRLKAPATPEAVTVRQLLNHTSGIVGDYFGDHGPGDDCIALYARALAEHDAAHPPGLVFSYCNAAFTLAGYLLEELTGTPYHELFAERLCKPLGLGQTLLAAEQMLAFRYAAGHMPAPGGVMEPVPELFLPRSSTPAGSRTSATASDVLRFAQMHLDDGTAADGTRVLSAASARLMQQPTVDYPQEPGGSFGLGWMLGEWGRQRMIGHPGGTFGQKAFLFLLPERRFGVCLLTNADSGSALWHELGRWLFRELAGVEMPRLPEALEPGHGLDLERYTGTYERLSNRYEVEADGEELIVTWTCTEPGAEGAPQQWRLKPADAQRFITIVDDVPQLVSFLEPDADGRPTYIHASSRSAPRTDQPTSPES